MQWAGVQNALRTTGEKAATPGPVSEHISAVGSEAQSPDSHLRGRGAWAASHLPLPPWFGAASRESRPGPLACPGPRPGALLGSERLGEGPSVPAERSRVRTSGLLRALQSPVWGSASALGLAREPGTES